jgi:hypothetical protein
MLRNDARVVADVIRASEVVRNFVELRLDELKYLSINHEFYIY